MKKLLRNLLLSLIVVIPFNVAALTYTLGDAQDGESGIKYVSIVVYDTDGVTAYSDKLSCTVDNQDVGCEIEAYGTGFTKEGERITSTTGPFESNSVIGRVKLTNKKSSSATNFLLNLKYGNNGENHNSKTIDEISGKSSDDATLHKLSVNVGEIDPAFKSDVDTYTIYGISDTHRRIKFTYECDNCSVSFEGGASSNGSEIELNTGENSVKAIVRSQDGNNTKTYNFTVIRGTTSYNSSKLKSLTIGEYEITPKFDKDTLEYEVKVPKKIENIDKIIKYETDDSGAKAAVEGANKLDKDENIVKITVTARDGSKTEYTIKVIKENVDEIIEVIGYKDNKVSYMNVEGVREELSEEEFKKQYPNDWAKIEDGTYKFDENGNIIKEQQQANEEPKKEEKKNSFPWLIVVLIVLAIIIIAVAGFFIFRDPDKKDKDGKSKKDKKDDEEVEEIVPTEEEQEHLDDIDSYNEEARLIAEDNLAKEAEAEVKAEETVVEEETQSEEPKEEIVKEETIEDYKVDEEKSPTMDIDEALSDLMNTKEYNFKD